MKKLMVLVMAMSLLLVGGCFGNNSKKVENNQGKQVSITEVIKAVSDSKNIANKKVDGRLENGVYYNDGTEVKYYSVEYLATLSNDAINKLAIALNNASTNKRTSGFVLLNKVLNFSDLDKYTGPESFNGKAEDFLGYKALVRNVGTGEITHADGTSVTTEAAIKALAVTSGSLEVTLTGANTPIVTDFTVTLSINGVTATAIAPTSFSWDGAKGVAKIGVPVVAATNATQVLNYTVKFAKSEISTLMTIEAFQVVVTAVAVDETSIKYTVKKDGNEVAKDVTMNVDKIAYNTPTIVSITFEGKVYNVSVTLQDPYTVDVQLADVSSGYEKVYSPALEATTEQGIATDGTFLKEKTTGAGIITLKADGSTIMRVKVTIKNNGIVDTKLTGTVLFDSKVGVDTSIREAIIDQGTAVFNVKLPNYEITKKDVISVKIKNADQKPYLNGKTSGKFITEYKGKDTTGTTSTIYDIDKVEASYIGQSAVADRVKVYVGGVKSGDIDAIKTAIKDQLIIYNNIVSSNAITVLKVIDATLLNEATGAYAFTAALKLEQFKDNNNYAYNNDIKDIKINTTSLLRDNGYNYWEVATKVDGRLKQKSLTRDASIPTAQKFMLVDFKAPTMAKVIPQSTSNKLGNYSILVLFDEPVERKTAELPSNWTLNAMTLDPTYVQYIRVLEEKDGGDATNATLADAVTPLLVDLYGEQAATQAKLRNCVIIQLTSAGAAKYFVNGTNLIQVKNVMDWAGVSDKTGNNTIITQDLRFDYTKPVINAGISIVKESPEQYVITIKGGPLYTDVNTTTKVTYTHNTTPVYYWNADGTTNSAVISASEINKYLRVGLVETAKDITTNSAVYFADLSKDDSSKRWYRIYPANPFIVDGNERYIVELTADWTTILKSYFGGDEKPVYHDKWFRVEFTQDVFNTNQDKLTIGRDSTFTSVKVPEDTKSPFIDVKNNKKVYTFIGAKKVEDDTSAADRTQYTKGTWEDKSLDIGKIKISMSEPSQLFRITTGSVLETTMLPYVTPSLQQKDIGGVPVPTFEYVKVETNSTSSAGTKVEGTFEIFNETEHDYTFQVKPTKILEKGEWKLVVRSISDDVGNTMATEEILFTVGEGATVVNAARPVWPYVTWSYAKTNVVKNGVTNDYVYILYSRKMKEDAIRAATYTISGKQLDQHADITAQSYIGYYVGYNVDGVDWYYGQKYDKTKTNNKSNTLTLEVTGPTGVKETITVNDGEYIMPKWQPYLVTIKLPAGFLEGDNMDGSDPRITNALQLPRTLEAEDDGLAATPELLQFSNNSGSNEYELEFDRKANLTRYTENSNLVENPTMNLYGKNGIVLKHPAFYVSGTTTAVSLTVVPPIGYVTYGYIVTAQGYENYVNPLGTATISVTVSAITTNSAIVSGKATSGATITLGGTSVIADPVTGNYSFTVAGLAANSTQTYTLTATKAGYITSSTTATVTVQKTAVIIGTRKAHSTIAMLNLLDVAPGFLPAGVDKIEFYGEGNYRDFVTVTGGVFSKTTLNIGNTDKVITIKAFSGATEVTSQLNTVTYNVPTI